MEGVVLNSGIIIEEDKCAGCHLCELACSVSRENTISLWMARIRVFEKRGVSPHFTISVCKQCENPLCVKSCPTSALKKINGVIRLERELCVGCFECERACPFNAVFGYGFTQYPLICDLCGGTPLCVSLCPTGAIVYRG